MGLRTIYLVEYFVNVHIRKYGIIPYCISLIRKLLTVVYENFSYVYQRAGKLRLLSRDEIRRFKKTWAKFDKYATGYIMKDQVAPFLSV